MRLLNLPLLLITLPCIIFGELIPSQIQPVNGSFLYKCLNSTLPEKLDLPVSKRPVATSPNDYSFQSFTLVQQESPVPCKYQTLMVSLKEGVEQIRNFNEAGHLRVLSSTHLIIVSPEKFCIANTTSDEIIVNLCPVTCLSEPCLPKCCPPGLSLSIKIDGQVDCTVALENITEPLFPSHSNVFPGQDESFPVTSTQQRCEDTERLQVEIKPAEEFFSDFLDFESKAEINGSECIDYIMDPPSPSEVNVSSWKLARLSCNEEGLDTKFRSNIKSTRHNFLYKCSGPVSVLSSFIQIPEPLRMRYLDEFLKYYQASTNYTSLFDFNLIERELMCGGETFIVSVSDYNNSTVDEKQIYLNFTPDAFLAYTAKSLVNGTAKTDEIYFHRENFCISSITEDSISVKFCKSKCSINGNEAGSHMCLPKCCFMGAIMQLDADGILCDYMNSATWVPEIYKNEFVDDKVSNVYPQFHYIDDEALKSWKCNSGENDEDTYIKHNKSAYRILSDGRVMTRLNKNFVNYKSLEEVFTGTNPREFCIDAYWDGSKPYDPANSPVVIHRCKINRIGDEKRKAMKERLESSVLSTKILIFLVYLPCALIYLLIIVIYVSIWEKQNVQGWTVMAFATCQFFVYIFICNLLGATVFGNLPLLLLQYPSFCAFSGVMHYFFLVSTFTWTLILTFDVWAKLSSMTPTSRYYKGRKRFFGYSCFALGVPIMTSIVAISVEYSHKMDETQVVLPGFRNECLISKKIPFLLYVVVVNSLIFVGNIVFGFLTFKSLWEAKKNVQSLKTKSNSTSNAFENKVALVGKLMMLMGFVLIFEVVCKYSNLHRMSIWVNALEFYRLFHAVGLFWIFVCSDKTTKQLQEKYPESRMWSVVKSSESSRMGTSSTRDTSSTAMP